MCLRQCPRGSWCSLGGIAPQGLQAVYTQKLTYLLVTITHTWHWLSLVQLTSLPIKHTR
jgi:hypothetical protein